MLPNWARLNWMQSVGFAMILKHYHGLNWESPFRGLNRYPRAKALEKERFTPNECVYAKYRYGLGKKQLAFCHHPEGSFAMHAVLKSAQAVTFYCPKIFKDRRWNCSSVEFLPKAPPDISRCKSYKDNVIAQLHLWFYNNKIPLIILQ